MQKRGDNLKRIYHIISFLIASLFLVQVSYASSISWYCIRNKNHDQPSIGKDLVFSEKYDLFWCDKKIRDDINDKVIYLTFDAGYENGNVEKIVDILNEENVKGAFFVLDNFLIKNQDLVKKMIKNGHIIANHTLKHKDMTKVKSKDEFRKELESLENLYNDLYEEEMPKYYRPPEGKLNEQNLIWAKELGYKTIMWSFAYADWDNKKQPSKEYAMKKIFDNLHNGEVMLLHPTSETNKEIMKDMIKELKNQGYRFGTLDELCKE